MSMKRCAVARKRVVVGMVLLAAGLAPVGAQQAPRASYTVLVGAESADLIQRVRFAAGRAEVTATIPVGESAAELEGPHGLQVSPDGRVLHFSTGHGNPTGKYWRLHLGPDTLLARGVFLGSFPASLDVTPDGLYAFVANFNLHGRMVPSSMSVVYAPTSTEVARITTCTMPHGSRVTADGRWHYSACMMDDQLVEIDAARLVVSRRLSVAGDDARPLAADDLGHHAHAMPRGTMPAASCSPTWAQPSPDGTKVYVACNKADRILEVDRASWTVTRRFPTGRGPYNLAVSPDGQWLLATLKQGGAVQLFNLRDGSSVMQERTTTTVAHGVVFSPDSRYAFTSAEGVGAEPGRVDVWDIAARRKVASAAVGQQAGGIAFEGMRVDER